MGDYNENTFNRIYEIFDRHKNCLEDYERIIKLCPKKLMSRGIDLHGMFFPENELSKYFVYKGKLVNNEKSRHYTYYFDESDKLRLTERYVEKGKLNNLIFYYHYENSIETIWYDTLRKEIHQIEFIDYHGGKLSRYVYTHDIARELRNGIKIDSYQEFLFDKDEDYVLKRLYDFSNGKPWEMHSKMMKH